ncbi:FeoC-like transcriptional regulator [Haloimpatiens sp. FM7330]|uniref:FeoC-like transcriptional regulator n=1 Tax=Haloimpatiens sp. FM7330 TaxID=3298610 RepID=UPI0036370C72
MRLLKIISKKGLYSRSKIADELRISISMLNGLLDQLIRMKYIVKVNMADKCSGNCKSCSSCSCCSSNSGIEFWKITDKGKNTLEENRNLSI